MNQDEALLLVREQDIKQRLAGGQVFIEFLASPNGDLSQWTNIDRIVDSLAMYWVSTSNHKVELLGLDILSLLVERLQGDFQAYYNLIHSTLVDRLGDQKDQVRDASITLLTNIMDATASPQILFEKLASGFSHKSWRVREGLCRLLVATINRFGAKSLHLSRLIPHLCKLLGDQHAQVRDHAVLTIVEIYRHVGDRVRQDLAKKGLPPSKLHNLYEKFDIVLQSGDMVVASETGSVASSSGSFESLDSGSSHGFGRVPVSSAAAPRTMQMLDVVDSGTARPSTAQPKKSTSKSLVTRSNAGAVDEESFVRDFELNLPPVRVYSPRDVDEQMARIEQVLANEGRDWEERTKALRSLRSVALSGGTEFDSFYQHLRMMEPALQGNAKDLRSQVVKETCVTIGFLSSTLKHRFEHSACVLFPTLFGLVPNSAKVMSTSAILAIRTTLKHTHAQRIVPIVTSYASSRTTSIRRHTFAFIALIFEHWATHILDKHTQVLKEAVQKGIGDADAEAREEARRAWHGLHQHYPAEADEVFHSLNLNQQRLIKGPVSASSVDSVSSSSTSRKSRTSLTTSGVGPRRVVSRAPPSAGLRAPGVSGGNKFLRSRSDIDPISAKRSQMKALSSGYGTLGRTKRLNTHTLSVSKSSLADQERGRNTGRPAASQPGSRSGSPPYHPGRASAVAGRTSRLPQYHDTNTDGAPTRTPPSSPTPTRRSRIPVSNSRTGSRAGSRLGSRAGSPTGSRGGSPPRYKGGRSTSHGAPMRVLPKGKEGEQAIHDALSRKLFRKSEYNSDDDDMSDTSSVCSERSYTSRNGMKRQQATVEDVGEILQMCQSTQWTERKEGLTCLHTLIYRKKNFSRIQMKRVLEIFNRMFADPHGKVFSMFLEMLPDFIANYASELHEWLYVLLTQLLKKTGTDLLGSVQAKVNKALQIARESFPTQLQFNILSRYIVDQTQRPNLKVKQGLLEFLIELSAMMKPGEITNTSDTRLALSRIITWTTEPKSQPVRKAAEALVIAIFQLNAPAFTNMLRVLPKTFQDGAMKVLQSEKSPESTTSLETKPGGHVIGLAGVSPNENFVEGDAGSLNLRSPRGSTDEMDGSEIAENFRDIAEGIQKLRMDSSTEELVRLRENLSSPTKHTDLHKPVHHRTPTGKENKYNPHAYSSPGKLLLGLDDDDAFGGDLPESQDNNIADVAFAFTSGKEKSRALETLCAVLRGSDALGGLAASQQQLQWDQHFKAILSGVLEAVRTGNVDTRVAALHSLKEMLRRLSNRFHAFAETTVVHVLEAHRHPSKEVSRSADDCGNSLASLLPSPLCVKVLSPLTKSSSIEAAPACLKMLTNAINRSTPEEMTNQIVADLVPGLLQCYDNPESGIRKAAVFCLVALHRVIGDANLCRHLGSLSGGKMKLLQLYIKRSQQAIDGSTQDL